jgi:hypothetical protein
MDTICVDTIHLISLIDAFIDTEFQENISGNIDDIVYILKCGITNNKYKNIIDLMDEINKITKEIKEQLKFFGPRHTITSKYIYGTCFLAEYVVCLINEMQYIDHNHNHDYDQYIEMIIESLGQIKTNKHIVNKYIEFLKKSYVINLNLVLSKALKNNTNDNFLMSLLTKY